MRGLSAADEAVFELGAIPYRLVHPGTECGVVTAPAGTELKGVEPVVCDGSADQPGPRRTRRSALSTWKRPLGGRRS